VPSDTCTGQLRLNRPLSAPSHFTSRAVSALNEFGNALSALRLVKGLSSALSQVGRALSTLNLVKRLH